MDKRFRLTFRAWAPLIVVMILCASCAPGFVVNSASDDPDANPGDGNCQTASNECTLRAAIMEGNAGSGAIIEFDNVSTITPATELPPLTAGGFRIEGKGEVTLDGAQPLDCSGFSGLELKSSFNTIQGLTISNFGTGIYINGFYPAGEAKSNVIGLGPGSEDPELEHNVLTDNCRGIYIRGQGAFGNTLAGNFIGTDGGGTVAMPNNHGIIMGNGAHHNLIGSSSGDSFSPFNSDELSAYWTMDEASGAAADSLGPNFLNEKDGTISSAAGVLNTGRDFELDDTEYFSRADNSDFSTGDIDFTWSLWVKPESVGQNMWLIQKASPPQSLADYEYLLLLVANAGNAPRFRVGNGSIYANVTANTTLSAGSWYHIVAWHDAANDEIGISVNGSAVTAAYTAGGQDTSGHLVVGASLLNNTPGNYFDGVVDEVGFWKRVLSPQEIAALYNNGNGLAYVEADPYRNVISGNNSSGIFMDDSDFNHFTGNYIGTALGGFAALPNTGSGIYMASGADNNVIGINQSGEGGGNLISGNGDDGILIQSSTSNFVAGNWIGTDASGENSLGNGHSGIFVLPGLAANIIGTNGDGSGDDLEGNVISGNGQDVCRPGIWLNSGLNIVAGNYIGTNSEGAPGLGNCGSGITIQVDGNRIGTNGDGTSDGLEANVISGNGISGVNVSSSFNQISGNFIGTNPGGTLALGNGFAGIALSAASHDNLIGTNGDGMADVAERNIISGNAVYFNGFAGISIAGDNNIIAGNYIGVNASGSASIPNMQYGITLSSEATVNRIGTDGNGVADAAEGNLISGNGWHGISVSGDLNRISGNLIGTNAAGNAAIPNGVTYDAGYGVGLNAGAAGNLIGTNGDGNGDLAERNIISGNARNAVSLYGTGTTNNVIAGNYIGTDITGTSALPNGGIGVDISSGPSSNRIGTNGDGLADAAEANVISGNTYGVFIIVAASNQITGNFIGTDKTGTIPLGNGADGIHINASNQGNTNGNVVGGSTGKANVIAYNQQDGVEVTGTGVYPLNTPILYNSIFSNSWLGINLRPGDLFYGISPNDSLDVDSGANTLMNFPELSFALALNNAVNISGEMVDGLPNAAHLIQFFSNPSCDPSGNGEGQVYLGESNEMTNGSGDVSFLVNLMVTVQPGHFITATATNANNTSEFSACVEIVAGESFSQEIEGGFNITPLRNLNCRYYCTQQSDIADTLLEGIQYIPIGWDPATGFFAFEGPSFGQLCFAPPVSGGTDLMSLNFNGQAITSEELTSEMVPQRACPVFPTATDVDEGGEATSTPTPGPSPTPRATATPTPRVRATPTR